MDIGWKIVSAGSLIVVGIAANKALDLGWKAATGHAPPQEEDDPSGSLREAILFAAISGATVAIVRRLALRGAAKWYGDAVAKNAALRSTS